MTRPNEILTVRRVWEQPKPVLFALVIALALFVAAACVPA